MPQIAATAELAPGTLYLYFPSKTALYAELLLEGYRLLFARLERRVAQSGSPREQTETLVDVFLEFAQDSPEYFDILFFLMVRENSSAEAVLAPDQMARLRAQEEACKSLAAQVLQRAGRTSASVALTVDAIWSMLAGVVCYFREDDAVAFADVAVEAKRLILDALFGSAPSGTSPGGRV